MGISKQRAAGLLTGLLWAVVSGSPVLADDTEIFFVDPAIVVAKPNILFIVDNSGSMAGQVTSQGAYDPAAVYPDAGCGIGRVYWTTTGGTNPPLPNCASPGNQWFNRSALVCRDGASRFAAGTVRYRTRLMQYDPNVGGPTPQTWLAIDPAEKDRIVECRNDRGIHSDGVNPAFYARNGNVSPWGPASNEISWTNTDTTLWESNYLNWWYGPAGSRVKLDIVKWVARNLLNSMDEVNVGLVTYNDNEGGHVDHALEDIATARAPLIAEINALTPDTWTPLSETLFEAYRYYVGGNLRYGNIGPVRSVDASRLVPGGPTYKSVLEEGCQKNFIIYLTDGEPTQDRSADVNIASLIGHACDGSPGDGWCLDDLAEYMGPARGTDMMTSLPGDQRVTTYTIGFGLNVPVMQETANDSGGAYFQANDAAQLADALTSILFEILDDASTFTSPAVSVNSFNRTRNLNDLFISVFQATSDVHWPGNLKKYKLRPTDGVIIDANGANAVDAGSGFFATGTQSYWSPTPDGPVIGDGGAANMLPAPATRSVYTSIAGGDLNDPANAVATTNGGITDALVGTTAGATGMAFGDPTRDEVIDFARGLNPLTMRQRFEMGDPLHAPASSVTYDMSTTLIFFVTNDGYLHAIDAGTGIEQWAFIPPEFLDDQADLLKNQPALNRHYGIDGVPRIQMRADNDGIIEAGEKVLLTFGMRRGGDFYYGLDVTNPGDPQLLWRLPGAGPHQLPGNGQSWSNPVPARMDIPGSGQNADKLVLVFGAGYDVKHDDYNMVGTDNSGKGIFIVDSVSGNVLWHGAPSGGTADFANMNYAIPADVRVIDLNTDGYADRMYAADMGGQVWRFDVSNGNAASSLVAGGVIAQLGGAPQATPALADTRRFYYAPDVALVNADTPFLHVGIGSGHRERPNSIFNEDRFYSIRDYNTFRKLTQGQYDAITPVTEGDLVDVTANVNATIPAGGAGWMLQLVRAGEKVLAESRTFNNQVFFTSFEPGAGAGNSTSCQPALGTNRLYTVSVFNGAPVNNLDGSVATDPFSTADRYRTFNGSLASEPVFIFPSPDDPVNCVGDQCTPDPIMCVDLFCLPPGFANNPVRTFWSEESLD
jgi:type IV pilus assembly protein PilY1